MRMRQISYLLSLCVLLQLSTSQKLASNECSPFYAFAPNQHFDPNPKFEEDQMLEDCDKVYDFHFYTSAHQMYSNRSLASSHSASHSVVSMGFCEKPKSILVYDGHSHPTFASSSQLYTQYFQQHYHSHSRHSSGNENSLPSQEELRKIFQQQDESTSVVTAPIGWQRFTLYDFAVPKKLQLIENSQEGEDNGSSSGGSGEQKKISLCYSGEWKTYLSSRCMYEREDNYIPQNRTGYFGGNSYYFLMKGKNNNRVYYNEREDDVRLWAPVADNGDGRYFIKIRVDDPGEYEILVYRDHNRGCAVAECDTPDSICDDQFLSPMEREKAQTDNIFMKLVAKMTMNFTTSDTWPPWKKESQRFPPECPKDEIGIVPGRWINPNYLLSTQGPHQFPESHIFGDLSWPFVWQPFDCFIPAFPAGDCLKNCIFSHKLAFGGLSRERTNSFDIEDFAGKHMTYQRIQDVLILENRNYYFPMYYPQISDRPFWNQPGYCLNVSLNVTVYDLADYKLCNLSETDLSDPKINHNPFGFLLNEEIYWMSTSTVKERWKPALSHFKEQVVKFCAKENTTWVYKTSIPVSRQDKYQTWQKFFEISRLSAKLAAQNKKMKVIDSFIMALPFLHDVSVFPDGVHLYTHTKFQGNFVSKVTTMMFLRMLCPSCE
jgi:hypothetical protein